MKRNHRTHHIVARHAWLPLLLVSLCALSIARSADNPLPPPDAAQGAPIRVEGPKEGMLNTEVSLRALLPDALDEQVQAKTVRVEWVVDGSVIQVGDWLRCRSAKPSCARSCESSSKAFWISSGCWPR